MHTVGPGAHAPSSTPTPFPLSTRRKAARTPRRFRTPRPRRATAHGGALETGSALNASRLCAPRRTASSAPQFSVVRLQPVPPRVDRSVRRSMDKGPISSLLSGLECLGPIENTRDTQRRRDVKARQATIAPGELAAATRIGHNVGVSFDAPSRSSHSRPSHHPGAPAAFTRSFNPKPQHLSDPVGRGVLTPLMTFRSETMPAGRLTGSPRRAPMGRPQHSSRLRLSSAPIRPTASSTFSAVHSVVALKENR
jgi:hypothetical protein